jgi:hypothetical protein
MSTSRNSRKFMLRFEISVARRSTQQYICKFSDSRVAIGCSARGRSSSFRLIRASSRSLGLKILGRKRMAHIWASSKANVADDPSRFVKLRYPETPPEWRKVHLLGKGRLRPSAVAHAQQAAGDSAVGLARTLEASLRPSEVWVSG